MSDFQLLIRGGDPHPAIGIADGRIVAFEEGSADETIDATGRWILPGAIDAHVHFNEPGRTDWEGLSTGSQACAAAGTTTFFDMPLNSSPPVCDAAAFHAKRQLAEEKSHVDFALWGGLTPDNLDQLETLHECGVIGLKAFLSNSGIDDFFRADFASLRQGMQTAAHLDLLVAVHAEIDHPELQSGSSIRDYLASRPIAIELEAIRAALDLAGETGCRLHVVHVSSAEGVRLIAEAARGGLDVTCETCPHYLVLNDTDVERIGALAKCAPPLRAEDQRLALLHEVRVGHVNTIGSDHSPSPMSMKTDPDFFKVWGGIAGCQHLLALLLDLGLPRALIERVCAATPADRFRIAPRKGRVAIGADADLVLFEPNDDGVITADSLFYRHPVSPYVGRKMHGSVERTLLRSQTVYQEGRVCGAPQGQLLQPSRPNLS